MQTTGHHSNDDEDDDKDDHRDVDDGERGRSIPVRVWGTTDRASQFGHAKEVACHSLQTMEHLLQVRKRLLIFGCESTKQAHISIVLPISRHPRLPQLCQLLQPAPCVICSILPLAHKVPYKYCSTAFFTECDCK